MKKSLRVGVIGLGVGARHVETYTRHHDCEVVALCDFSEQKGRWARERYPLLRFSANADELLDAVDIDLVSIASYDHYHFEQIIKAVQQGKHVFVEKPLCLFRKEAIAIRKLLKEHPGVRLSSNLNLRTSPRFRRARRDVLEGEMGMVFHIEGDYLWGRASKLISGWRGEMDFYSIVYGAGVHMIDLIMWITGERPVEVQGYGNQIATEGSGFKHNDMAVIILRFEHGMTAKVAAISGCVHPHFHRLAIYGTKGTFLSELTGARELAVREGAPEAREVLEEYPGVAFKKDVITTFVDSILEDSPERAIVPCDDVFASMSVCFAAERAIQEGRLVRVEYI